MENLENSVENTENIDNATSQEELVDRLVEKRFTELNNKVENKSVHNFNIIGSHKDFNAEFRSFLSTKAMTTTSDPVLVPAQYSEKIVEAFGNYGIARRNAFVQTLDSNTLIIPRVTTSANPTAYWLSELSSSADTKVDTQPVTLTMKALQSEVKFTKEMLNSANYDILGLTQRGIGRKFAIATDSSAFMGAGTVADPFTGLFNDPNILSYTQARAGSLTGMTYADLVNMEAKLDSTFRPNAKWIFDQTTFAAVKGMMDLNNRPIFDSTNKTILEYPYEVISAGVLNSTSVTAAGSKYFALADMSEAIWIGDNTQLEVLVDPYTLASTRQVRYIYTLMSAIGIANPNAGVIYKIQ